MPSLVETLREAPSLPEGSDERKLRNRLAAAMMQEGMQTSRIGHWTQGAARLANALVGGYMAGESERAAGREEKAEAESVFDLPGIDRMPPTVPNTASPTAGVPGGLPPTMPNYADAIARNESGGRYDAVGPEVKKDGRVHHAYGKYQVMDFNIPNWTEEVLGKRMTPQEFVANPQAQEAVFNTKFNQYVQQYGNPQDAASAWFTGRPLSQGAGARDVTGTSGQQYVNRFNASLGGVPGQPPAMRGGAPQPGPGMPGGVPGVSTALFGGPQGAPQGASPALAMAPQAPPQGGPQPGARPVMQASLGGPAGMPPQGMPPQGVPQGAPAGLPPQGAPQGQPQLAQAGPQIPPQIQQAIQRLWANRSTRPQAQQLYLQYSKPPQFGFQTAGDQIYRTDPRTGQVTPITQVAPKPTSAMQEYEFARGQGYQGSFTDFQLQKQRAGATNVTTTVGGEKIPDVLLKSAVEGTSKADTLQGQVDELSNFRDVLRTTPTGWAESTSLPMRQALKSLGMIRDENIPAQELVRAMQNQQALRMRNPESGFGLTGNTSDRDVKFLQSTVGGLQNTAQANEAIMTVMIAKQRREAQMERAKADFIFETGSLKGWGDRRKEMIEQTPFFTPEEQQSLVRLKQQASAAGGAPQPGFTDSGYRFKGGNPADRNNWERVQ